MVKRLSAPTGAKKIHESGMYWDENLDMWTGGVVNINLYDNTVGYYAGQTIAGSVDIEVLRPFKAGELTIELVGMERGHLDATGVLAPLDWHRESVETVAMKTVVATFDDNTQLQPGQYTYSFQVFLPSWLPESSAFNSGKHKFYTEYVLRAQMMPTEQALLAVDSRFPQKFGKISQFRGSRTIYIYKAYEAPPQLNYKLSLKAEVGGLGVKLFGSSVSTFEVTFPRNTYYPGEKVAV